MTDKQNPREFEFIVHIGTGKTGSSSIQKSLLASQVALRARGIAYLGLMCEGGPIKRYDWQKAGGWTDLTANGMPQAEKQLREILFDNIRELRTQGYKQAILSNETIFGNDKLVAPILKEMEADGVAVKVIVYVRRHDAWARSAYLQWGLKHKTYTGPIKTFKEWYKDRKVHFAAGLGPWVETKWADIAVRNFDTCGDAVADFLEYYGLRFEGVEVRRDNETPNPVALALWAMFNSQFEETVLPIKLQRLLHESGVLYAAPQDVDFMALLPKPEDIEMVRRDSAQDRERINAIFSKFSQPPVDVSPLNSKGATASQNQINAALLLMIQRQEAEIEQLRQKLRQHVRREV